MLHGMSHDLTTFALHVTSSYRVQSEGRRVCVGGTLRGVTARLSPRSAPSAGSAFYTKQQFNCEVSFHSSVTGTKRERE